MSYFQKSIRSVLYVLFLIITSSACKQHQVEDAKINLGHHLFFETKISINQTKSCASCHSPEFAFTDGYRRSITSLGENVLHNAPSLLNVSKLHYFDWANCNATTLLKQIQRPLYNNHPIELGMDLHLDSLVRFFEKDSVYASLFKLAFPNESKHYTKAQIEESITSYESQLNSMNSAFDKHALSNSATRGFNLFKSSRLKCASCHPPPMFSLTYVSSNIDSVYANIGLYNVQNKNTYPLQDIGLMAISQKTSDNGKFKIPSLRNVLLTAPYMHDGSINTIEEVIAMYARGGRNVDYGDYAGDGKRNQNKHRLITGFTLSKEERTDLINFLASLSDTTIHSNPLFQNPFLISQ